MRKRRIVLVAVAVVLGCLAVEPVRAGSAGAPFTGTGHYPLDFKMSVYVPCANGGAGEVIALSGHLNIMWHVTAWPDGRVLFKLRNNWPSQIWSGVGQTSGETFDAHGTLERTEITGTRSVATATARIQLVSRGSGENYALFSLWHITLHPDGTVSAMVDRFTAACQAGN